MFEKLFDRLFPSKTPVTVHELLKRSEKEVQDYEKWLLDRSYIPLLRHTVEELESKDPKADVLIFAHTASNGIVIYFGHWTTERDFKHLLFWLASKVTTIGYIQVQADKYTKEQGSMVESKSRIYLKTRSIKSPVDQLYGNILLELVCNNDKPSYIKLQANTYSGRNFEDPKPFEDLIAFLLQSD